MPTGIDDTAAQVQPDQGYNPQASRIGSYLFQNRPAQPQPTAAPQPAPQPTPDTPPPGYIKYGNQYHPGYIDPGTFTQIENLTKDKAIEHRAYVYPDLDSATKQTGGAWKTTFLNPVSGQWYGDTVDANGNNFMEGEDLILPNAGAQDPQLKDFVLMLLGIISASRGMPLDELMMTYNASYSASRMTRLAFEKILGIKRQAHDDNFEAPIYEMWLACEIANGTINCPGWNDPILKAAWTSHTLAGPTMPDIDPEKTANANKANLAMGATNLDAVARTTNGSSGAHNRQRNKASVGELVTWPWEVKITEKLTPPED